MRGFSALVLGLVFVLASGVATVQAQVSPIVGRWSFARQYSNGQTAYVLIMTFWPNGGFQQQVLTNMGTVTYSGGYRFDPGRQVLSFVVNDFQPRQLCRYGNCLPVTPTLRVGTPYTVQLRFESRVRFQLMDASGAMLFIRQQ